MQHLYDTANVLPAFGLTLFAGLATGLGAALGFVAKKSDTRFLALSLGFSAGVMLYVSFVEILLKARESLQLAAGEAAGAWITAGAFFGGIAMAALIDKLVPEAGNPHEMPAASELGPDGHPSQDYAKLMRMGTFTALAIAIHNFPEGLATFTAALRDPSIGVPIAVAIAIHNVPEGIAVSMPVYYATGSRRKAFGYSFLSGLAEPLGALAGYLILLPFFSDTTFGILFAGVAGIMVFISLDELLPAAEEYGEHHWCIYGLVAGMGVMALSLLLFL